jgi:CheY-like chemotaxis protein
VNSDRRRWQRFAVPAKVQLAPKGGGSPFEARVQDISAGGAFIISQHPPPAFRTKVRAAFFTVYDANIELDAEVVHVLPGGFGIEFASTTPDWVRDQLDAWVAGKPLPKPPNVEVKIEPAEPFDPAPPLDPESRPSSSRTSDLAAPRRTSDIPGVRGKTADLPPPRSATGDLPRARTGEFPPARISTRDIPVAGKATRGPRILLVQDNRDMSKLLMNILREMGAEVTVLGDPKSLSHTLALQPFDLVICDWPQLDQDPETILKSIRATAPRSPIVIVSAQAKNISYDKRLRGYGASELVKKPFLLNDLIATLDRALARR